MGIWPFYTKDDDKKPSVDPEQHKGEDTTQIESNMPSEITTQTIATAEEENTPQKPKAQTVLVEGHLVVIEDQTTENNRQTSETRLDVAKEVPVTSDEPTIEKQEAQLQPKQGLEQPQSQEEQPSSQYEQPKPQQEQPWYEQNLQVELAHVMQSMMRHIDLKLESIQRTNEERQRQLNELLEEKENIIKQQHNQLLKFQDDVIYKTQHGIIMELIGIADNVRTILKTQQEQKDYNELLDDVEKLQGWIESSLQESGVRKFEEVSTLGFNPKRHSIVDSQPAPQPEQVGTYITEQPGYEWSIPYVIIRSDVQLQNFMAENKVPKAFKYVIRQEEVIKLK